MNKYHLGKEITNITPSDPRVKSGPRQECLLYYHRRKQQYCRDGSFPGGAFGKEPACQCRKLKRLGFNPWVEKIPWRKAWQSTPVCLPGKSHGQRSLAGYSPWG